MVNSGHLWEDAWNSTFFMREKGPLNNMSTPITPPTITSKLPPIQWLRVKIGNVILVWFGLIFLWFGLIFLYNALNCCGWNWLDSATRHKQNIIRSDTVLPMMPWPKWCIKRLVSSTQYRGRLCLPAGTSTLVVPGHGMAGPQTPPHCQIISTKHSEATFIHMFYDWESSSANKSSFSRL